MGEDPDNPVWVGEDPDNPVCVGEDPDNPVCVGEDPDDPVWVGEGPDDEIRVGAPDDLTGVGEDPEEVNTVGEGESETDRTDATGWFEALGRCTTAARAAPAATTAIARAGRDGCPGRAEMPELDPAAQRDPLRGGALNRGRRARGPQGRQQERRLTEVRTAVILPVPAVSAGRGRLEPGDKGGRVGRAAPRVLGHPGGDQRPQRFGHRLQRHRLGVMLAEQLIGGLPAEGRAAGEALVEGGRGRVDVAGRAGRGAGRSARAPRTAGCPPGPGGHRRAPRCRSRSAC